MAGADEGAGISRQRSMLADQILQSYPRPEDHQKQVGPSPQRRKAVVHSEPIDQESRYQHLERVLVLQVVITPLAHKYPHIDACA